MRPASTHLSAAPAHRCGSAINDPDHHRIELRLVQCVSAGDAERGVEFAGDPGHDLEGMQALDPRFRGGDGVCADRP